MLKVTKHTDKTLSLKTTSTEGLPSPKAKLRSNRPFLVWGAFYARQLMNPVHLGYPHAYEFYISHRNLSNFTASIAPRTSTYHVFASRVTEPIWWGQNCFTGEYVTLGTYYIYAIAFGKVSAPFSLTITSILRTK